MGNPCTAVHSPEWQACTRAFAREKLIPGREKSTVFYSRCGFVLRSTAEEPGHEGGASRQSHAPSASWRPPPTFGFPLSRIFASPPGAVPAPPLLAPSPFKQRGLGSPLTSRGASTRKTKKSERRSRRWSKSVHTESSSRVEASPGQLVGDPSIRRSVPLGTLSPVKKRVARRSLRAFVIGQESSEIFRRFSFLFFPFSFPFETETVCGWDCDTSQ